MPISFQMYFVRFLIFHFGSTGLLFEHVKTLKMVLQFKIFNLKSDFNNILHTDILKHHYPSHFATSFYFIHIDIRFHFIRRSFEVNDFFSNRFYRIGKGSLILHLLECSINNFLQYVIFNKLQFVILL